MDSNTGPIQGDSGLRAKAIVRIRRPGQERGSGREFEEELEGRKDEHGKPLPSAKNDKSDAGKARRDPKPPADGDVGSRLDVTG